MHTNYGLRGHFELDYRDFALQFGVEAKTLSPTVREMIDAGNWGIEVLHGVERDKVLLDVLRKIDGGKLTLTGYRERWDKGWAENLAAFRESGDVGALRPKYIRTGQPIRMGRCFVRPDDPEFEWNWYRIFRHWLFETYLSDVGTVYEFGCGTGHNLAALAQMYPDKRYVGLDWSSPAIETVDALGKQFGWQMTGRRFNFFCPDQNLKLDTNCGILTIGALEQTGQEYASFMKWLVKQRPAVCIHVEPIPEWYNPDSLVEYTALRFLAVRNYWSGFPALMAKLAGDGLVEIVEKQRTHIGSLYLEGYMLYVWRISDGLWSNRQEGSSDW